MASGGQDRRNKMSASEPGQRFRWQRTSTSDKDDNISLNSLPNDIRPNNWDFSDWKPAGNKDQTKRRKKGNPEWEREQSLTQDSPPSSEKHQGTPHTFPRTKITPSTPTAEKVALENLRQAMTFSDQEDVVSNEGERKVERNVLRREENFQDLGREERRTMVGGTLKPVTKDSVNRNNRNNNKQNQTEIRAVPPDSSQIVGRLMQIREYIKQASSMMDTLKKSVDTPGYTHEMDRLQSLMGHLKEQERGYTGILQNLLSVKEGPDVSDAVGKYCETFDESRSVDLDLQSDISDKEERAMSASSRPRIEDNLGLTSDNDDIEEAVSSEESENSSTMDDTVISGVKNKGWAYELGLSESDMDGVNNPHEAAETLVALRQQQELLQKLIEQQEQMRALRGRQAALLALQQDAEGKLLSTRQKSNEAYFISNGLEEETVSMTERVDRFSASHSLAESNTSRPHQTDSELLEIRQQLQYLRNELKIQNERSDDKAVQERSLQGMHKDPRLTKQTSPRPLSPMTSGRSANQSDDQLVRAMTPPTDMSKEQLKARLQELTGKKDKLDKLIQEEFANPILPVPTDQMNRDELQNKLRELQGKKRRMDVMLQELQSLRSNSVFPLNNAVTITDSSGQKTPPNEIEQVASSAPGTDNLTDGVLHILDARQKMNKLNEVKDQLAQLKTLVKLYESTEDNGHITLQGEEQSVLPVFKEHEEEPQVCEHRGNDSKAKVIQAMAPQANTSSSHSTSDSESESHLSGLGPWGDDPEIQEKVRKLKAAKEKLKHLQNLVAVVQHSPGIADVIQDNLGEIRVGETESQPTQTDVKNNETKAGSCTQVDRDAYYKRKIEEQMNELKDLKNEKTQLLSLQSQLQSLHDKFTQAESGRQKQDGQDTVAKSPLKTEPEQQNNQQQSGGPSVTFSSNDEVYYKMRNQRMLREELRDKKKQLESIMKKDRNKKQYYKNQDNQSDTVSYSTEMFGMGASVDQTMATWGGSTVDNLESITEDDAAQDNDEDAEDDDAYPIDGILQVEEEEEENQSDNETYTVDDDMRQMGQAGIRTKSAVKEVPIRRGKRSFPRSRRQANTTDFNKWSRSGRKIKQENYRSAQDIVQEDEDQVSNKSAIEELQRKLEETSLLCQSLLGDHQSSTLLGRKSAAGHSQLHLQQQLQQQQLMMSLNQCYQQISMQQMEMQNMQRQMQSLLYQLASCDVNESGFASDLRVRPSSSLYSPMIPRQSPNILLPQSDAFHFNPVHQHQSPASNILLRHAVETESCNRSDVLENSDRQRVSSRQIVQDAYLPRCNKKSVSPPQQKSTSSRRSKSTQVQEYPEADESQVYIQEPETFEQYLERKRREFIEKKLLRDKTQGQSTEEGLRQRIKSKFGFDDQRYRPGLSAGISGAGYAEDGQSICSSMMSSVLAVQKTSETDTRESRRDAEDCMEMSLFETLRETIYSEVATLISQNENRPHYLVELFRELQSLTTDYLRQRVLYDIKDVVSKYLVEENSVSEPPPVWMNKTFCNFNSAELTPSESNLTTDDEEVKSLLQKKLKKKVAASLEEKRRQKAVQLIQSGSLKNDKYDYQEPAEVTSSVSTPSDSLWENPFASDSLGQTAVDLEKALVKMKEYEKRLAARKDTAKVVSHLQGKDISGENISTMDQGEESSINSDSVPYPRIDTQQLDQQIKSIMTEVIPVIKEHMENMCSPQLLAYIKRLVLSLTRQYDSGEEFARFFHRQLGSILQDSLAKYEGRKMRECGEDLLVDMSEVLFNELAFFRLMQDLEDPVFTEKMEKAKTQCDEEIDVQVTTKEDEGDLGRESEDESDTTESTAANASDNQDDTRPTQTEEEDLGKARDDALANEVEIQDADEKDDESPVQGVQIELAPSETKPYTRIGSDEDDESADDESQSNEDDPSETAVSINARKITDSNFTDDNEDDITRQDSASRVKTISEKAEGILEFDSNLGTDADQGASNEKFERQSLENVNGDILNGDIEVITLDDLPPSLSFKTSGNLEQQLTEEHQSNSGAAALLGTIEITQEWAGDNQFLKQPDEESG